jgi:predicted nucleic acid-binding Zn ribbon protein
VWEDIVIAESSWFTVDEHNVYEVLKAAQDNYYAAKNRAKTMMRYNREKFTYQKMLELVNKVIGKYTKDIATPVSLNLPKLQKTSNNPSPELKLPSLKRIT